MRKYFEAGNTIGAAGKPRGAKNKLHKSFIEALQADFDVHGKAAIAIVRVEDPAAYLRVIASVLPRELEVSQVSDVDLEATIAEVRALLAAPVEQPLLIEHNDGQERETLSSRNSESGSELPGAPEA